MDIETLLDEKAIVDLTIRYTWAIDSKNWDDLDTVFLPDATGDLARGIQQNRDEIKKRISGALKGLDGSQHTVSNHEVSIAGDTATSRCYLHAQHIRRSNRGDLLFVVAGRYEDDLVRTPAGWRIKHRQLVITWTEGDIAALAPR